VRVARPATAGAQRKPAGHLRLGGRRERARLLVAHVHPVDPTAGRILAAAHRVHHGVQAVADHPVDPAHPHLNEDLDLATPSVVAQSPGLQDVADQLTTLARREQPDV
jgi:hypothetical protein